jgi:thiosulfate dehydrogenase [quinone] large subunit
MTTTLHTRPTPQPTAKPPIIREPGMVPVPTPAVTAPKVPVTTPAVRYVYAALRLGLGWMFLWAFLDKLFGFGFATPEKSAWINGGHPTKGFLANAATGPFTGFYHSIAGATWTDWVFMLGLAGIGLALITGVGVRIAATTGSIMLLMMWSVVLPPENNPFFDEHLVFIGVLIALAMVNAGDMFGFGKMWGRTALVRKYPFLK